MLPPDQKSPDRRAAVKSGLQLPSTIYHRSYISNAPHHHPPIMSQFALPSSSNASPVSTPTTHHRQSYPFPPAFSTRPPSTSSDDDEEDDLPYPQPLSRPAFLSPSFSPASYLASLGGRHQTLEDLRGELRARVAELGRELVDLVNGEYEALMGVGMGLRGGEDRVEGVRVGVLGFEREVAAVREEVARRRREVQGVIAERRRVRDGVVLGRRLVEVWERTGEVERRLGVGEGGEETDEEDGEGVERTAELYAQLIGVVGLVGEHPFVEAQRPRIRAVRDALVSDLGVALKAARTERDQDAVLRLIASYRDIGEGAEAVRALKTK